jgi:hypothetical protein
VKYLWNNSVDLIAGGAVLIAFAFVCAFLAHEGLGLIFHIAYLGCITVGGIFLLCGAILFGLRFGVKSEPSKVILVALFAQALLAIPVLLLHRQINFYLRLYGPLAGLIAGGLAFVSIEMASLLLLIGLIRRFYYERPQS